MDEEFLLAINGDWDALLAALRDNRMLAYQTDGNGMTLLHWVCLHQDIPTEVLIKIVFANPHAVNIPNDAGHLPVDLAVQAECEERILEVLRAADKSRQDHEPELASSIPQGTFSSPMREGPYGYNYPEEEDMTFEDPRYFANQSDHDHPHFQQQQAQPTVQARNFLSGLDQLDSVSSPYHRGGSHGSRGLQSPIHEDLPLATNYGMARKPLYSIYSGINPGDLQSKSLSLADDRFRRQNYDSTSAAADDYNSFRLEASSDSHLLQTRQSPAKWQTKGSVTKGTSFPPRWKQSRSCHVCASRFTLTHRRHHCRNCGFSVCGQHSTNRVPLPRFGLGEPQRVCDKCFLAGRHVFGSVGGSGSIGVGGGAMSVASGSEHHYDLQQQYGRHDSFGSLRP